MDSQTPPVISVTSAGPNIVRFSLKPPESKDGQQTSSIPVRSRMIAQIPIALAEPSHGQHSSSTPAQPRQIEWMLPAASESVVEQPSVKPADDDPYRTYLPPSRSPTETEDVGGKWNASASAIAESIVEDKLPRASTVDDAGVERSHLLDGSPVGKEKFSRPFTDHSRPRPMRQRIGNVSDIAQSISKAMAKRKEIGLDRTEQYISDSDLCKLITEDSISKTLLTDDKTLISFIRRNMKLFTITLLVINDQRSRLEAMESFHEHNFSDHSLPVKNMTKHGICQEHSQLPEFSEKESDSDAAESGDNQSDTNLECRHGPEADAFHYLPWTSALFRTFYEKQWSFLIPKFRKDVGKHNLHDRTVLPIREVMAANHGDEGHFSVVCKAKLLAEYQDAIKTTKEMICVAIKELKQHSGPAYNVEREWQNEIEALSVFNKLGDDHIIKGIGAFKQRSKYYLLMEWADGGSLQQFWEKHPNPHLDLSGFKVMQLLKQFRGLANALHKMHHYHVPQGEMNTSPVTINTPGNNSNETSWRHGDLKPGNILLFKDASNWLGMLKIGDLGRARHHIERTGQRNIGTREQFGTWRYEPPEAWTSLSAPRSRLYDIWSFGCVILESVIWILRGATELKAFEPVGLELGNESPYWTYDTERINHKSAKIRDVVSARMQQMLDELPKPSALRDLVALVKEKLLIVKVSPDAYIFTKGCRANSFTLWEALDTIISKANEDSSYLFQESGEISTRAPSPGHVVPKMDYLTPDRPITPGNFVARRTSMPFVGRPDGNSTRKNDSYVHDFDDTWRLEEDNVFAQKVHAQAEIDIQKLTPRKTSLLCDKCQTLDFATPGLKIRDFSQELRARMREGCELCAMRLRVGGKYPSNEKIEFEKVSSGLRINGAARGLPILSLCRTASKDERLDKGPNYVQIGFPTIPRAGSAAHFCLLRAWLEDCDENHKACRQSHTGTAYPTRLIDVGSTDSPTLRLIESNSLTESQKMSLKYIALSHPWGDPKFHRHLCTTTKNIGDFKLEIRDEIPETLADAVKTTRGLGVPYLWIDSLCIIQGDDGDFTEEAERMETVYSSAYCVIAATNADGSSSGFLKRDSKREVNRQVEQDVVGLPCRPENGDSNSKIYVNVAFDNFQKDVRESPMNQRGWVFQERALAHRTIHFANNQTYWECGEGIRCETLTKMKNTYEMFLGDPNFPSYGLQHRKGGDIAFYEFLYEQYSNMSFTRPEDRPVAIGGLEQRLIRALKEKGNSGLGNFGIFDDYWGRGLLWKRASDVPKMIRLTSGARGGNPAPSWSWMGHTGGITFMRHDPHSVEWLANEIILPWSNLKGPRTSTTTYRGELELRGFVRDFRLPKVEDAAGKMHIVYEDEDRLCGRKLKCLIIGRMIVENRKINQVRNYVLILAQESPGRYDVYERVGAGFLHGSLIEFDKSPLSASIK